MKSRDPNNTVEQLFKDQLPEALTQDCYQDALNKGKIPLLPGASSGKTKLPDTSPHFGY